MVLIVPSAPRVDTGLSTGKKMGKLVQSVQVACKKYQGHGSLSEPIGPKFSCTLFSTRML